MNKLDIVRPRNTKKVEPTLHCTGSDLAVNIDIDSEGRTAVIARGLPGEIHHVPVDLGVWTAAIINHLRSGIRDVPVVIDPGFSGSYLPGSYLRGLLRTLVSSATTSLEPQVANIEARFARLANQWHNETDFLSSPSRITSNDAYLEILTMGKHAIPLILQDLKERGGDWYTALRIISGENPVPMEAWGDVEQMKNIWLKWGRDRGYIE